MQVLCVNGLGWHLGHLANLQLGSLGMERSIPRLLRARIHESPATELGKLAMGCTGLTTEGTPSCRKAALPSQRLLTSLFQEDFPALAVPTHLTKLGSLGGHEGFATINRGRSWNSHGFGYITTVLPPKVFLLCGSSR